MKDVINMNLRHITNFGGLSIQGVPVVGCASPERTYLVSPNLVLNDQAHQSPTIQGAIDMAYADYGPITDFSYRVIILVYPGKYEEQIHSYRGYHIQGFTHEASAERKTAVLYNTGVDADHYPLRGEDTDNYYIEGINIEVDSGGVIGKICGSYFTKVHFKYGDFIEATEIENTYTAFKDCAFNQAGFNLTGVQITGRHTIQVTDCRFTQYTWVTTSTNIDTCAFYIDNCVFSRAYPNLGGDWKMQILNSHIFGNDKTQIDTTSDIVILDSIISNGLHFVSNPATVKIHSCNFNDNEGYTITDEDITADVDVTNVSYSQNSQQDGISGRIQVIGDFVNVGNHSINRYATIQDAIDSLPLGGIISIAPGTYTEQIHSTANIVIQGRTHEGVPAVKSTVLYNTGADAAHYPLGGNDTDVFTINDITIKTEPGAIIGKLSASNFTGCVFENGHFIESTANQAMLMGMVDCSFENSMAFNLTGAGSGGLRAMTIVGCYFNDHATHWKLDSTHTSTLVIVKNTIFHNFYPDTGGNWQVEYSNCHCFGPSRSVISTTNKIAYIQCIISNGLHFTSDPSSTTIQLCTFNDDCGYAITGEDITATVEVTDVDYVQNVQQNGISGRIHTASNVVNVGNESVCRYYTIQDAIDSLTSGGMVFIAPGTYTEQIHSNANITLQGYTTEGPPSKKATIIYNTGVDAAHYPLGGNDDDYYVINDITIETDAGGVIGKLDSHKFSGCVFSKGHFIEATKNADMLMGLDNCTFIESMAFNFTGVGTGGLRAMTVNGCFFGDHATHWVMNSTHTSTLVIIKNCILHRNYMDIGGNWQVEVSDCHLMGTSRGVISTTNKITFIKCILANGLHFTSNPDTIVHLCTFNDDCGYSITGSDITTTVDVTDVDYVNNVQQNGLPGTFKYLCPIKPVGCNMVNRYTTIQGAIDSVVGEGTVMLYENFTGLAELTMPNEIDLTIDCQKTYSLAFTGDIIEIGNNRKCGFNNFVALTGGEINLNGTSAEVSFEDCQYITAHLVINNGAFSIIYKSSFFGSTGNPAVTMNSLTCPFIVGYARVQGSTGQAAILTTVEADDMLKVKFSSLISGTPSTVAPLIYSGANKLSVYLYNCGLSGGFDAAGYTNEIGQANLTYDPNITF